MMSQRKVLLVGSVPLANAEEVFRAAGRHLGDRVQRIPDGETGPRLNWVEWQNHVFEQHPMLALGDQHAGHEDWRNKGVAEAFKARSWYRLKPGVKANELVFGPLGYAKSAKDSFEIFLRCKREGVVAPDVKFQVSLPTPYNVIDQRIDPADRLTVEPPYEARLLAEIDEICQAVPHEQLAIQWDVAHEVQNLEGGRPHWFDNAEAEILERLVRLAGGVPRTVELGIHLCYGDFAHRHFIEPKDTALMTRLGNRLCQEVARPIAWLHLPVPRGRTDDAYYAPLAELKLPAQTQLFLGLVHYTDGCDGAMARIKAAQRHVGEFGIATECGLGRRSPDTIIPLLRLHAEIADAAL